MGEPIARCAPRNDALSAGARAGAGARRAGVDGHRQAQRALRIVGLLLDLLQVVFPSSYLNDLANAVIVVPVGGVAGMLMGVASGKNDRSRRSCVTACVP